MAANFAMKTRDYQAASNMARSALMIDKNCHAAERIVFQVYGIRKQNEEALARLTKLKREERFSLFQLAQLAVSSGQYDHAEELLRRQRQSQPGNPTYFRQYLQLLIRLGRIGVAHEHLREIGAKFDSDRGIAAIRSKIALMVELCGLEEQIQTRPDSIDLNPALIEGIIQASQAAGPAPRKSGGIKIAVVINSLGPGGAERQCTIACRTLAECRGRLSIAEVRLFCRNDLQVEHDAFYLKEMEAAGVSVVQYFNPSTRITPETFAGGEKIGLLLSLLQPPIRGQVTMQLINMLAAYGPDVIYGWQNEGVLQAGLAKSVIPEAQIIGRWGSMPPSFGRAASPRDLLEAKEYRRAYRSIRRNFPDARFMANSKATASSFSRWLHWDDDAVGVIYNGHDFSRINPAADARATIRRHIGIPLDAYVFGGVFRMSEEKRPILWLDIAAEISRRCRENVHFIIVGDGPLLAQILKRLEEQPQSNVHVVGRKSNIADWYVSMDAFLLTSNVEGMSNSVIEAQSFGLPVICFKVGGLEEAVVHGRTGFLVQDNDKANFVQRSIDIAENRSRSREMGDAGRKFSAETFTIERLAGSMAMVLHSATWHE